jgi:diacylglycerol O-acyltransferase / wax synthase
VLGGRIEAIYPFVPLSPQNHALSIGMISYDGRIYFGLAGDRDVVPDLDDLAAALGEALREQPVPRAKAKGPAKRTARRGKVATRG